MRTSSHKLNISFKNQLTKSFAQVVADFKTLDEANVFLENFLNESELETFTKRLMIAYWLKKGRSYSNIKNNLRVSTATIATVQSQIDTPGFKLALKKLEAEEWATKWSGKIQNVLK